MNVCRKCVLTDTFPGIRFDRDGVCNYCSDGANRSARYRDERERFRNKFDHILRHYKEERRGPYDVITAFSGGKDSSFTLKVLKETYGLQVLAVSFDNGFMSPQAVQNIRTVTAALNIDSITMSPGRTMLAAAFRRSVSESLYPVKALIRASAICNTCMHLVKAFVLKLAVQMGIPFIAYGWSPGQAPVQSSVMRLNPPMVRQMQRTVVDTLKPVMGEGLARFVLGPRDYDVMTVNKNPANGGYIYAVHPLAFFDYNEEAIVNEIRTLGWTPPLDTDPNSTNCLLNLFANQVHIEQHRFHPYAHEVAGLVREGYMTREAGIAKLSALPDPGILQKVGSQLGMP